MTMIRCRHFSGYKPCARNMDCNHSCSSYDEVTQNVLVVHLGAIGAVVRSTSLISAILEKYPQAKLHWLTQKPCDDLLRGHPRVDHVWTNQDLPQLKVFQFAAALVIDKDLKAIGLVQNLKVQEWFGFQADPVSGSIVPANPEALELWQIGLSNQMKFYVNRKSEAQLLHESLNLGPYKKEGYNLPLSDLERMERHRRKSVWSDGGQYFLFGMNTGCSAVLNQKKWTVSEWVRVLNSLREELKTHRQNARFVLLGGEEDFLRNQKIAEHFEQNEVILSPMQEGLRDGMTSIAACDVVLTGDSLGMHMAIAQKIPVVAWFGPTCAHEIEFYSLGTAVKSTHACSPCWNRNCQVQNKCNEHVDAQAIVKAALMWMRKLRRPSRAESMQTFL